MQGAAFFEIPVVDLDRAVSFFSQVFGIAIERTEIDGNAIALFPDDADGRGVSGALALGESYVPSLDGPRVYLAVASIDAVLERVEELGGAVLYPKTSIGVWGWVAEFQDSEGSRIALSATDD